MIETNSPVVYLSGPIAGCTDEECRDWRRKATEVLTNPVTGRLSVGDGTCRVIDPMDRDYRGRCDDMYHEVVELDKRDIRNSNFMLINWSRPSVGTSMEILYAWQHNVMNVLVLPKDLPTHDISPWLMYHCIKTTNDLREAIEWIKQHGRIKIRR